MKNDFNGKITVVEQAEYLSKHGHFMVRTEEDKSLHFTKYYLFNGNGYAVTYYDEEIPVQIQKMKVDDVMLIAECKKLEFGGF